MKEQKTVAKGQTHRGLFCQQWLAMTGGNYTINASALSEYWDQQQEQIVCFLPCYMFARSIYNVWPVLEMEAVGNLWSD